MTRKEIYNRTIDVAQRAYDPQEAAAVAERLCRDLYGFGRFEVTLEGEVVPEGFALEAFEHTLERLRLGEPVQYIVGHTEFLGRVFVVREGVLIPRPETEELVMHIVRSCHAPNPHIIDIGTGSGAIAISLALEIPQARVEAIDLSPSAVAISRENAARLGADVAIMEQDIFSFAPLSESYDIVVSNPPYIPIAEREEMRRNVVDFEPSEALFVPNESPLLFYERIADVAQCGLKVGGMLCFEIHERLATETAEMLRSKGFLNVQILEDFNSKPRMILCLK